MTNAQVYHAFKSYVSRLHDVLNVRRNKKTKPRLVIVSGNPHCNLLGSTTETVTFADNHLHLVCSFRLQEGRQHVHPAWHFWRGVSTIPSPVHDVT